MLSSSCSAREARLRRAAARQGLWLRKSRRTGDWYVINPWRNFLIVDGLDLEEAEQWMRDVADDLNPWDRYRVA